ncbi:sugar transferase [Acidovorax sp.]|uniref:sugar transferase n=1 Tax=Acidovorax sp. TaxID=1872122 RepID=UPI0026295F35|nr:sugar transferase [Acidovorax sp.]
MKRLIDIFLAVVASMLLILPLLLLALWIKATSPGPVLYWSQRVGRNNRLFAMPKFRSMRIDTPEVATHLLVSPEQWLTPAGSFLRRSSLDELPQLWNILTGEMSFVGPRPALHNQHDLIAQRTSHGVHHLYPGLTGWAQINGRDELPIDQKVALEFWYLQHRSLALDLRILLRTTRKVLHRDGVIH